MLDSIRKRSGNILYTVIIVAVVAVMAMFGMDQMMSSDQRGQGGVAAWVNGEAISNREFQQELQQRMVQYQSLMGGQYDERFLMALQIPQRTLDELVQFKLLAQQANSMNIAVPDEELAAFIRTIPYYQKDGKFNAELYARIPNRGVQERRQRERLKVQKLQTFLSGRIRVTPAQLRANYQLMETKADLTYAKIDFNELAKNVKVSAAERKKLLAEVKDGDYERYYNANKTSQFTERAQAKISQIRVGIPYQASEEQKKKSKEKIDAIYESLKSGNFAAVAKKESDDEYAKKGGVVGWIDRGTLETPLEAAIDTVEPGKYTKPVETSFGYFIVKVEDKKDQVVHPLDKVKDKIARALIVEKKKAGFVKETEEKWNAMLAKGQSIEGALRRNKVEFKDTGPFAVGQGFIPGIGQEEKLVDAVFSLTKKNRVAKQLFPVQGFHYYVKLKSIEQPEMAELEKNRESVEKQVQTSLQTEVISRWVRDLEKKAQIKKEVNFGDAAAMPAAG